MTGTLWKRLVMRRPKGEYGFTLIEMLIVVVVLGLLGAIVVFAAQNLRSAAAESACRADARVVQTGVQAYKVQMGAYPPSVAALASPGLAADGVTVVGPWLRSIPSTQHYVLATMGGVVTVDSAASDPTPLGAPLDLSTVPDACSQATAA